MINNKINTGSDGLDHDSNSYLIYQNNFLHNPDDWSLLGLSDFEFLVQIIYFSFTSLSTVGLGDFYPIADEERILCSFILLFGVAIVSYTLG